MTKRLPTLISLTLLFIGECFFTDLLAQNPCDSALPLVVKNALGYRSRGDRCEGLYIKQVGSTTLHVASFTENFEDYDINSGRDLLIEWDKPPDNKTIHLRAQGVKPKLYYRMDTYRPAGNRSYLWPSGILASLKILKKDIGIVGLATFFIGQAEQNVYLPLRIRQNGTSSRTRDYTLLLLPGVQLSEVYISLASVGPDGRPANFIKQGERLGYGYYPAERGIEIPVSGLQGSGFYYLQIAATLRSGSSSSIELWFYNN